MVNPKINYSVDILMFLCLVSLIITTFWVTRWHHLLGIVMFIVLGIHILLHLKVFLGMTKGILNLGQKPQETNPEQNLQETN